MGRAGAGDPRGDTAGFAVLDLSAAPLLEPVYDVETIAGPLFGPTADQIVTSCLAQSGVWEWPETQYLQRTVGSGQTFVDVGAHIGYFSVLAAKLVGPTGTVIAVEPEARNRDLLHRNLARNGCSTAQVIPFAAGSASELMSLAFDEENRGAHRLVNRDDPEARADVRCVRLDDVLPSHVDFVKVDAQGYDHEVIDGLERTLATNPEASVMVELSRFELARRGVDRATVLAGYEELDFALSMFRADGTLRRSSAAEVLEYMADPRSPDDFSIVLERLPTARFEPDSRPKQAVDLIIRETAEGLSITQPGRDRAHELNQTAALVFDLCTGEQPVASIVALVRELYDLSEAPSDEVLACLDRMRREGLVT